MMTKFKDSAHSVDCNRVGDYHSDDRVMVYYGSEQPYRVCGYHASQLSPALFIELAQTTK